MERSENIAQLNEIAKGQAGEFDWIENKEGVEDREEPEKYYVDNTIFEAYLEGNGRIPQTGVGIAIFTMASLVERDHAAWENFFKSELSQEQINRIGAILSGMHKKIKVEIAAESHSHIFSETPKESLRILSADDLQEFWSGITDGTLRIMQNYVRMTLGTDIKIHMEEVAKFISEPDNHEAFKKLVIAIRDALKTPEAIDIQRRYRATFDRSKPGNEHHGVTTWVNQGFDAETWKVIEAYLERVAPDIDTTIAYKFWKMVEEA